jgi:flagellar protein FliO/FliZ
MRPLKAAALLCLLSYGQPLLAAEAGAMSTGLRAAASLLLVIGLMFALAWAVRRYGPVARVRKSLGLDVLGQVAVGNRASLALIRVGRSVLLIGVTASAVTLLKDMQEGDFEHSLSQYQGGERQ